MGLLVAALLCAYTLAKVIRDALLLANFGAFTLPYFYIGVAFASVAFVWMEGAISRRFMRINLVYMNQLLAIGFALAAALLYPVSRTWTTAAFYLWTGSQAMLLIPHFWVLALDVWDSHRARRLFPILSGCGLLGGLVGGGIAGWLTPFVRRVGLIWIVVALFVLVHLLTRSIDRHRARRVGPMEIATSLSRWEILRRSGYLRLLAAALALSVVVGTLIDFQFKTFIQRAYPDPHALTQFLGLFQVALNGLALVVQFGIVGWLFRRMGLATSSLLQPAAVMGFGAYVAATGGWWAVVVMRWIQGVVLQTLGKSTAEIYYMAVRPPERRRIKPAVDTLVERWSDALVGVLLIILLHAMGASVLTLILVTIGVSAVWLVVLFLLNRQYGRSFQGALSYGWIEPDAAPESLTTPAAARAIQAALQSEDDRQVILALRLCVNVRTRPIKRSVRGLLGHGSPAVRAAAIEAMEAMHLPDPEKIIDRFLSGHDEGVSRAAIRYLLTTNRHSVGFIRELLDGDDPSLRRLAVEALVERPEAARGALTLEWVDARIAAGETESLLLAARALGAIPGSAARARLSKLLVDPDVEVKRAALLSVAKRPSAELLERVLPLLFVPELPTEARLALAAIGDAAVPAVARFLDGANSARAQALAARTLADLGSPRAADAILGLVRSGDLGQRLLGLRSMSQIRAQIGRPVLPRGLVHKLFLREIRGYRLWIEPALELERSSDPEISLLAESYREFSEAALERALRALSCWYDPKPLSGAFQRLRSRDFETTAPALEYLGNILPHSIFRSMSEIFEAKLVREGDARPPSTDQISHWVRSAWESGDAWLRACAVRASRVLPGADRAWFSGSDPSPLVQAELAVRFPRC